MKLSRKPSSYNVIQMETALKGRRILITRTRTQASALSAELERLGAIPLLIPTIEIAPPSSFRKLDQVIAGKNFDWLLFTSANAVYAFTQRAEALNQVSRATCLAAIGPATEHALRTTNAFAGASHIYTPAVAVAESLAEMLLPHVSHLLAIRGVAHLALIRAEVARDHLPETLIAAGATLTIAPAYRNILPGDSITLLQEALLDPSRAPEAVTFTSSSTAANFVDLLAATGIPLPPDILRISIGPVTSATLRDLHLPPHTEAEQPTIPALLTALQRAFASR